MGDSTNLLLQDAMGRGGCCCLTHAQTAGEKTPTCYNYPTIHKFSHLTYFYFISSNHGKKEKNQTLERTETARVFLSTLRQI